MRVAGSILAVLGLAALSGGMLFFGAVMAPLVFLHLPPAVAGPFIRGAFPWYYGYCIGAAAVTGLGLLLRREWLLLLVPGAVIIVTWWLWLYWLPVLDALRVAHDAAGFARGHEVSVWVNGVEFLGAVMLLVRMGARVG